MKKVDGRESKKLLIIALIILFIVLVLVYFNKYKNASEKSVYLQPQQSSWQPMALNYYQYGTFLQAIFGGNGNIDSLGIPLTCPGYGIKSLDMILFYVTFPGSANNNNPIAPVILINSVNCGGFLSDVQAACSNYLQSLSSLGVCPSPCSDNSGNSKCTVSCVNGLIQLRAIKEKTCSTSRIG